MVGILIGITIFGKHMFSKQSRHNQPYDMNKSHSQLRYEGGSAVQAVWGDGHHGAHHGRV